MYVVHHNTLSDTDSMILTKTGFGYHFSKTG